MGINPNRFGLRSRIAEPAGVDSTRGLGYQVISGLELVPAELRLRGAGHADHERRAPVEAAAGFAEWMTRCTCLYRSGFGMDESLALIAGVWLGDTVAVAFLGGPNDLLTG